MDLSNFSLEGKVALITGASYGIGFAIAKAMHKAGATIVFNDIKRELVDKGLAAYEQEGIKAHGYVCDVTDEQAVNNMVATIEKEVGTYQGFAHFSLPLFPFWKLSDFNLLFGTRKFCDNQEI